MCKLKSLFHKIILLQVYNTVALSFITHQHYTKLMLFRIDYKNYFFIFHRCFDNPLKRIDGIR